jgi:hypothetical protein
MASFLRFNRATLKNGVDSMDPFYRYASACRPEGSLGFALKTNLDVTSTFILDIIHGHKAQLQLRSRFGNPKGEYFLLHDNNGRSRGKRNVIAVARKLS